MNEQEIKNIKEKIVNAREDIKRYKTFKYYKKECILNTKLHIKLLNDSLKELKGGLKNG
jgi:hypothetical protein